MKKNTSIICAEVIPKAENENSNGASDFKMTKRSSLNELSSEMYIKAHDTHPKAQIRPSDFSDYMNATGFTESKNMTEFAQIFYARIQKETEEFIQHLDKQMRPHQTLSLVDPQERLSAEDDEDIVKMKFLLMIHTTCSNITNLLMHPP